MTTIPTQSLSERSASIISMMLGLLRAQGLRGLVHLPALWLAAREFRRIGEEFAALLAAFHAGTLPPVPPPAPWPEPLEWQAAPAQRAAAPRVAARPAAPRRRPRPQPAPAKPARAVVRARPYPTPVPPNLPGRSADIPASARCTCAPPDSESPTHAYLVTIS
jgi:hypothetical protein